MSTVLYSVDKELLYPLFVSVLQSSQNINSVNFFKKKKFIYLAVLGLGCACIFTATRRIFFLVAACGIF